MITSPHLTPPHFYPQSALKDDTWTSDEWDLAVSQLRESVPAQCEFQEQPLGITKGADTQRGVQFSLVNLENSRPGVLSRVMFLLSVFLFFSCSFVCSCNFVS